MTASQRKCSMCRGDLGREVFPFGTRFNDQQFAYLECTSCRSVIVSPVPSAETFARMYAKDVYHDQHYSGVSLLPYQQSAALLARHLPSGARVLDYGCGAGAFLSCLAPVGLQGHGAEFDAEAAHQASVVSGCPTCCVADLAQMGEAARFDAIHLGDVLEHMPEPLEEINKLMKLLKPGGMLFLEGPLEVQASPVYWAARLFGGARRVLGRGVLSGGAPTHLIRTHAQAQRQFVRHLDGRFEELHWRVYETGWPYAHGGPIKRAIAVVARVLSMWGACAGWVLGNRFEAIYEVHPLRQGDQT